MGTYHTAQICLNGHSITRSIEISPERRQNHCDKCGAATIHQCPACESSIRGAHTTPGVVVFGSSHMVPRYCHNCGRAYPWTETKIRTAIQMFVEFGDLKDSENESIEHDIANIARDIPESELSAMRIKRIWDSGRRCAYELVMDFASRTAANVLKGS